jgi:hypothetical protein
MATTPLDLDTALVTAAANFAAASGRTTAGQIEFWVRLGRVADAAFTMDRARTLAESGNAPDLDALISTVDTPEDLSRAVAEIRRRPT